MKEMSNFKNQSSNFGMKIKAEVEIKVKKCNSRP
jgi:hypothetical protein